MLFLLATLAAAQDGTVTLPLSRWEGMLDEAGTYGVRPSAPVAVLQVDRSIEGSFRRGVFTGTLVTTVHVPPGFEQQRIPVLDGGASVAHVEVDGKTTSLLPEGGSYTVGVGGPGDHTVKVAFFLGREDDRFARHLQLVLPPAGPTRLSLWVAEADITPTVAQGAVTALRAEAGGTRIEGQLDGRGTLDLTWKGQQQGEAVPVKVEARENALFTLHEALVHGVVVLDTTVLEGETDHVALRLPDGVEVVDVEGDAVLQWRTEPGRLVVLLRYLVDDRTRIQVHFQLPVDLDQPVTLALPLPEAGVPYSGAIGVQGPAGLQAEVKSVTGAEALRDLPPDLAALTPNPLLLGFELRPPATGEAPAVVLGVTRQAEVELTSTSIDELEASTVLIEDGAEITRAQLHVRNQTRQYLAVKLPEGAVLTTARIDGRSIRPATSPDGSALLVPLVQSKRLDAGETQTWQVRPGDTLGDIADRFYGDPSAWGQLLDDNRDQLVTADDLEVGQVLRVTPARGGAVPESRFVIDLAWTRPGAVMGAIGRRALTLPELDADVETVTWHVYVPDALEPLAFGGNLTAYSHLRYDHVRRVRQFLDAAFGVRDAWAGGSPGDGYLNILSRRKSIYEAEVSDGEEAQEATGSFPLVGERYRFKRMLPGREVPALVVTWIARDLLPVVRLGALLAAAGLVLVALGDRRARPRVGVGFVGLLVVAWYVEGVHRSVLWGIDLALIAVVARAIWPELRSRLRLPSRAALLDAWTLPALGRGLVVTAGIAGLCLVPLLWSTLALAVLARRVRRLA
jgi:hypothetical protein